MTRTTNSGADCAVGGRYTLLHTYAVKNDNLQVKVKDINI